MTSETEALDGDLLERVLARLGLSRRPEPTLEGLRAIYAAWCREVPFDNVLKLIHLRGGDSGPLPGDDAGPFFETWLRHGVGGTCCAVTGALHALLSALGFTPRRALGTMLMRPGSPPNHGLAIVLLGDERYVLDATMLHVEPLRLDPREETAVEHPAWGVRCRPDDGGWIVRFRPMLKPEGLECRVGPPDATREQFVDLHEASRRWSPFNFELSARRNRGESVVGAAFGRRVELGPDGAARKEPLRGERRLRFLIEELGIAEELAVKVPPDKMTPAPPRDLLV